MQHDLHQQIIANIERDYGLKRRGSTPYMRGGKCTACGKKELYTNYEKPWVLRCGRQAKCGAEYHVKDIYSDLFEDWSNRFKQTTEAPNASADAYLQMHRARLLGFGIPLVNAKLFDINLPLSLIDRAPLS